MLIEALREKRAALNAVQVLPADGAAASLCLLLERDASERIRSPRRRVPAHWVKGDAVRLRQLLISIGDSADLERLMVDDHVYDEALGRLRARRLTEIAAAERLAGRLLGASGFPASAEEAARPSWPPPGARTLATRTAEIRSKAKLIQPKPDQRSEVASKARKRPKPTESPTTTKTKTKPKTKPKTKTRTRKAPAR